MKATAAAIAILLAPSAHAADDGFCAALRRIAAAAPGDFQGVAGEPEGRGGTSWRGLARPMFGGGAGPDCSVFAETGGVGTPAESRYECDRVYDGDSPPDDAAVAALAAQIAACFAAQVEIVPMRVRAEEGYPATRRIRASSAEILVSARRVPQIVVMNPRRLPHKEPAYRDNGEPVEYWLTVTVKRAGSTAAD